MQLKYRLYTVILTISALAVIVMAYGTTAKYGFKNFLPPADPLVELEPPEPIAPDSPTLVYPIKDREGDFITDKPNNPFYLADPGNIKKDVEYDPTTGKYIVTEKVGDVDIKEPIYMTYEEYLAYTEKEEREDYLKSRSNAVSLIEDKGLIPPINMKSQILDRLFGAPR
jgi:hypothetical protein